MKRKVYSSFFKSQKKKSTLLLFKTFSTAIGFFQNGMKLRWLEGTSEGAVPKYRDERLTEANATKFLTTEGSIKMEVLLWCKFTRFGRIH